MKSKQQARADISPEDTLNRCIYYGFHVLVIVLPLIISYRITNDQFDLAKLTFLRLISTYLFFCFAAKLLGDDSFKIKRASIDYPILIFLALICISSIFSIHHITSIFGKYKRYQGLLVYINYALLFFIASQFFESVDQVKSIARSMIIAACAVSAYGLLQYFGLDFLGWAMPFESGRSFSTFGNPVLLGGYLVIILPIALGYFYSMKNPRQQIAVGVMTLIILACLVTTFSRGAWFAALFCIIAFFVLSWKSLERRSKVALLLGSCLLIAVSVCWFFALRSSQSGVDIGERLTSGFLLRGSTLTRLEIWKSAVQMIKARPAFGFGPDCFRLIFRKYQTLEYKRLAGKLSIADDAHNYFLQLASMAGLATALSFIAILSVFLFSMVKYLGRLKGKKEYPIVLGFVLSVIGYLLYLIFGISVVGNASLLWLILGMMTGLSSQSTININWLSRQSLRGFLLIGVFLVSIVIAVFSLFPFCADSYFANAIDLEEIGYYDRSIAQYQKATFYFPYWDHYYYKIGQLNMKWTMATEDKIYFRRAVKALKTAEQISPLEADNYLQLADAYFFGAKYYDSRYYPKALKQLESAIKLEPYSSYAYYLIGTTHIAQRNFQEAIWNLKKAISIAPDFEEAYCYLGFAYEQSGQTQAAIRSYRKALSLDSENQAAKKALDRLESKK